MIKVRKFNKISDAIYDYMAKSKYEFLDDGNKYDAAIVRSQELKNEEFPKELLAIARAGAGVNNIPVERLTEAGVCVFNTPAANANAVKELVLCGMLLSCRRIISGAEWVKEQAEDGASDISITMEKAKKNFIGREISGKKLGIIGLGAVGAMVANAALSLNMEVIGYDPFLSVQAALRLSPDVKIANDINEIYKKCDFISLHVPQTPETKGMINKDVLKKFKKDAVLLNFARGGLVNDEAILDALDNGKLGRYVTDFPNETIAVNRNVIATPHLGASTPEAEENCAIMAAKELDEYIRTGNIRNSVNLPACDMPFSGGYRVAIINKNVPNMVGQITAVLAGEEHNIDHMINRSRGDFAYTMIDITDKPSRDCIKKLEAIAGIIRVRVIG